MTKYTVYFTQPAGASVRVEANDPDDAIEKAFDQLPGGVCAHCSGWGQSWTMDLDGEWKPEEVSNEEGDTVWGQPL